MAKLFNPLSYGKVKPIPLGKPVDDYRALFKKKDEDYNYVQDTIYSADTLLNRLPHNPNDAWIVDKAKEKLSTNFDTWKEQGDLENRVLDVKALANDLANKSGLATVQKRYAKRQGYITSLQEQYDKGEISRLDMNRAIADADKKDEGIEFNPETGTYVGTYSMRSVPKNINFAERYAKAVEGYKADGFVVDPRTGKPIHATTPEGKRIMVEPSTGKLITETGESVSEKELALALRMYAANDPDWKDRVTDDLYYETDAILYNPETKQRREMTTEDLDRLAGSYIPTKILAKYNVKDTDELIDKINEENLSPEDVYRDIRSEQMLDKAIAFGIAKEGYIKYNPKYMSPNTTDGSGDSFSTLNMGQLATVATKQHNGKEDIEQLSSALYDTNKQIEQKEKELKEVKVDAENDEVAADRVEELEKEITELNNFNELVKNNNFARMSTSPEVKKLINEAVTNEGGQELGFGTKAGLFYRGINPDKLNYAIKGLDINEAELMELALESINNDLTDEDLAEYIKQDKNSLLVEHYDTIKNQNVANFPGTHPQKQKQKEIRESLLKEGEKALVNLPTELKDSLIKKLNNEFDSSISRLRKKVEKIADTYTSTSDNDLPYTQNYHTIISPEKDAKGKRADKWIQLEGSLTSIKEKFPVDFYTKFTEAFTNSTINNVLEKKLDGTDFEDSTIENGRIKIEEATMIPFVDNIRTNTGDYVPGIQMTIPVTNSNGKKNTKISVTVTNPDSGYVQSFREAIVQQKQMLETKRRTAGLKPSEKELLEAVNKSIYTSSKYAKDLHTLGLNSLTFPSKENSITIPFKFWDGRSVGIQAYKGKSAQGKKFYLTNNKKGENLKYLAVDSGGNPILVKNEDLYGSKYTALGGNTTDDLLFTFSSIVDKGGWLAKEDFKVDIDGLKDVDIFPIVGNDVIPKLTSNAYKNASKLRGIKGLQVTDALRPTDSTYGAKQSTHKEGTSLDFRDNPVLRALADQPTEFLNNMGIAKIIADYDDGHIHVEFLNN